MNTDRGTVPWSWQASQAERTDSYPCDGLVAAPFTSVFRAIDVHAAPERLFRWLCQLKVAPYSYDLVDNLGRRSPRSLTPGADDLAPGQRFLVLFRISAFEPDVHITAATPGRSQACTYAVRTTNRGTRLVVRLDMTSRTPAHRLAGPALAWGDLVMMRKQLLTIRTLAEQSAR